MQWRQKGQPLHLRGFSKCLAETICQVCALEKARDTIKGAQDAFAWSFPTYLRFEPVSTRASCFFGKNMEIHSPIQLCESRQLPLHGFFQSIHLVQVSSACCLPVALSSDAAMQFSHQCTPSLQEELSLAGVQQFANDVLEIGSRSFDIHAANVIKRCTHQDVRYQLWFYII